jgi:hypothetical protein
MVPELTTSALFDETLMQVRKKRSVTKLVFHCPSALPAEA